MCFVGLCLVCAVTVVPPGSRLLHLQDGQERRSEEGMEGHGVSPPPPGTGGKMRGLAGAHCGHTRA